MAGNIQGNITEELEYLPSNLREYAIDKLAAGKLTEAEIQGLNEVLDGLFFIYIDTSEIRRVGTRNYRYSHPNCEACGKPTTQIHHEDRNPKNNEIKNLMAVCNHCHAAIHANMERRVMRYDLFLWGNNVFKATRLF